MPPGADSHEKLERDLQRYAAQVRFAPLGVEGQRRLKHGMVAVVGCGALGSMLASTLVRAGVGLVRVIDRDIVEIGNLHRQMLFDERDVADGLPKAEAAARHLRRMNSAVEVEAEVADVTSANIGLVCRDIDLIVDGTDNLETRFLLNDYAVDAGLPWVYAAVVAAEGLVLAIQPGASACLRCVWDELPPPGELPTCDTAGVLGPAAVVVASFAATEALKLLSGRTQDLLRGLLKIDVWRGRMHTLDVAERRTDCPCCGQRDFAFLRGERDAGTTVICGRNALQVTPAEAADVDLKRLAQRLPAHLRPQYNEFLLRFHTDDHQVTVFADGRALIQGTTDVAVARKVLAKYVGL